MKVAVSSNGKDLDASIDQRFGRCAYFLIIETDDMSFEVFDNESAALGGGAGIQSAQFVISKGAGAVITGNCGPNAVQVLSAAGVDVFLGVTGTIKAAVEMHKSKNLTPAGKANVAEYSGLSGQSTGARRQNRTPGGRTGSGRGLGQGRGTGQGRGMGQGRGRGQGSGMKTGRGRGRSGGR